MGFSNWKNETEKLKKHDDSGDHKTSVTKSILFEKKKETIVASISNHHASIGKENAKNLKIIIKLVIFCARQGIAFRGHNEKKNKYEKSGLEVGETKVSNNKGNFKRFKR